MKGLKNLILLAILCFFIDSIYGDALNRQEDLDLERQRRIINKAPVKTFHTKYGDVDCIDMYKQPAFDHPLLSNHTLQRKPSSLLYGAKKKTSTQYDRRRTSFPILHGCPDGTVPIRRTTRGDLIRERSQKILANSHVAYATVHAAKRIHGAQAAIDIYNPSCGPGQSSSAGIRIVDGPSEDADVIETGWMVNPDLYGDTHTHFYTWWTSGMENNGCYDIRCAGFVQVAKDMLVGGVFENVSSSTEVEHYETFVQVYQDVATSNWWLVDYDDYIGYWPKELFNYLKDGSTTVTYGGRVNGPVNQPSPPMGSGQLPNGPSDGYMRQILILASWGRFYAPPEGTEIYTDEPRCYGAVDLGDLGDPMGYTVVVGGPGGPGC